MCVPTRCKVDITLAINMMLRTGYPTSSAGIKGEGKPYQTVRLIVEAIGSVPTSACYLLPTTLGM